ncbi:MAG TPA: hypothetical protein VJ343_03295 [archaeon]|nr:hypothetical protein [archaeon]
MGLKKFLKEYNSLIPIVGGTIIAGAVGIAAYTIGFAQDISKEIQYISNTKDVLGGIWALYETASSVCGKYVIPGFVAGQALTYKLKKTIISVFR